MARLSFVSLCLWLGTALATTNSIELGIVFPKNETYNLGSGDAPIPVVFTLQNSAAATHYQYTIFWELNQVGGPFIGGDFINTLNNASKFNYTADSTATLVDSFQKTELEAGSYTLDWKVNMFICRSIKDGVQGNETSVASGTHYFTVADDGEEMALDSCPDYLGGFTVKDGIAPSPTCPRLVKEQPEKQPCNATLSKNQVACLSTYFAGNTSQDACQAGYASIPNAVNLTWSPPSNSSNPKPGLGDVYRLDWMTLVVSASLALGIVFFA